MFRENDNYGHNRVLAMYAGFDSPPPLWGMLQHGWNLGTGFSPYRPPSAIRLLVWSSANLAHARAVGFSKVSAIGAPFLYLVRHLGARTLSEAQGTIVYPFHSWEREDVVGDHAGYANYIIRRETPPITICLYWREYEQVSIRETYAKTGARVVCHGRRYDPSFLLRQLDELTRHRRLVTNRTSTALWYGAVLGMEVEVYGPLMGLRRVAEGVEFDREQRRRLPALFEGPLTGARGKALADHELGSSQVLTPEALRQVLGWTPWRRVVGPPLRSIVRATQFLRPHLPWQRRHGE
jgi:hypothetical protein